MAWSIRPLGGDGEMSDHWFADGLKFTCTRCGDCCSGKPGYVWVNDQEIEALAKVQGLPVDEVLSMHTFKTSRGRSIREKVNGDCIYYEAGKGCLVYEARPRQCQSWPFWESNLVSPAAWEKTTATCPGAGNGQLIKEEDILARMRMIRI